MDEYIPHVIKAEYVEDFIIRIEFDNGNIKTVDFEPYIKKGGIFSELGDKKYFQRFFVDLNTVCWPNGADIAPERLYEIGKNVHETQIV